MTCLALEFLVLPLALLLVCVLSEVFCPLIVRFVLTEVPVSWRSPRDCGLQVFWLRSVVQAPRAPCGSGGGMPIPDPLRGVHRFSASEHNTRVTKGRLLGCHPGCAGREMSRFRKVGDCSRSSLFLLVLLTSAQP